jgi:preprotein translocase subunit YajC
MLRLRAAGARLTLKIIGDAFQMDWLISTAAAQAAGAPGGGSSVQQMLFFMVPMILAFYFLLIRPQNKRAKEHRALVESLQSGAEVVTSGGILGKVTEVAEQVLSVEIAEGVIVKVQRHTITQILPKGTIKAI